MIFIWMKRNEVHRIISKNWDFLNKSWNKISLKYKHRTEIKHINEIHKIKKILVERLGYIPVFFFLNVLYNNIEYPGPYFEIEKGLFLLYHLTSGISGKNEIERYTI